MATTILMVSPGVQMRHGELGWPNVMYVTNVGTNNIGPLSLDETQNLTYTCEAACGGGKVSFYYAKVDYMPAPY